jgi:hypothetical protein
MKAPLVPTSRPIAPGTSVLQLWERPGNSIPPNCARLILTAEKELVAFMVSVERLFGEAASRRAGKYWVEELRGLRMSPANTFPDWRFFTIAAATRLAMEVTRGHPRITKGTSDRARFDREDNSE